MSNYPNSLFELKDSNVLKIAIINYPNASRSAVYGLQELFMLASTDLALHIEIIEFSEVQDVNFREAEWPIFDYLFIVPSNKTLIDEPSSRFYLTPPEYLQTWLMQQYQQGATLCAGCAGVFILAEAIKPIQLELTTHKMLETIFKDRFPDQSLNTNKLLIKHQSVITVSGVLSWFDLGCAVLQDRMSETALIAIKQAFFSEMPLTTYPQMEVEPQKLEGLSRIREVQQYLHNHIEKRIDLDSLANKFYLSKRTLQRQFNELTGMSVMHYLNSLKVKSMCEYLSTTELPFATIALKLGYTDVNSASKLFKRVMGVGTKAYRLSMK